MCENVFKIFFQKKEKCLKDKVYFPGIVKVVHLRSKGFCLYIGE